MDILEKLFSSGARVKVMRFFLMNQEDVFTLNDVSKTLKIPRAKARKEINFLRSIKFLDKGTKEVEITFGRKRKTKKRKEPGVRLSKLFPYLRELRSLVVESSSISRELLLKRFKKLGRGIRLVLLMGVFVGDSSGRTPDLLVVGDNIRRGLLEKMLRKIESEMGKELNYSFLSTQEFKYRRSMFDKFVNDILESQHDVLLDNLSSE